MKQRRLGGALVGAVTWAVALGGCGTLSPGGDAATRRGEKAFVDAGCHGCHTIGTFGTTMAGDLSSVGRRWSREKLAQWLRDPTSVDEQAHMPRLDLSDDQIAELARFLSTRR